MDISRIQLLPKSATGKILLVTGVFVVVISAVIIIGVRLSGAAREQAQQQLAEQFRAPETAIKSEVKRILLKKKLKSGEEVLVEILANGEVNVYDENHRLIKSGLQGFYDINNLFDRINLNLVQVGSDLTGSNSLTIVTNNGTTVIYFDDGLDEFLDEIVEDIEDFVDETFSPTPTPISPSPTITPGGPTLTPTPPMTPTITPTPLPGAPTATPTPLPQYYNAPPFTCDDYAYLGKPVAISNVVCGAD